MLQFAQTEYLLIILIIPFLFVLYAFSRRGRRKRLERFGDRAIIESLMPRVSKSRGWIKLSVFSLAIFFFAFGLARPQLGAKLKEVETKGVEIMIALDVSNSMLAEDYSPNRLERAKLAISRLADKLKEDRIGLIVFAGQAYVQLPITTDYVSAKIFLNNINSESAPVQGTALAEAINTSIKSFSPESKNSRAVILITDGENHEDDPVSKAAEAAKEGIVIHTIGIGSTDGVPVPVTINGKKEYLKDIDGNTVVSKLDEDILKRIAIATGGSYVRANNSNIGLDEIFREIKKMKKQEMESKMYTEYNDQFQIFAAISLFLLILDFIIMERKNRKLANIKLFKFGL